MTTRAGLNAIRDADYWRELNPALRVSESARPAGRTVAVPQAVV